MLDLASYSDRRTHVVYLFLTQILHTKRNDKEFVTIGLMRPRPSAPTFSINELHSAAPQPRPTALTELESHRSGFKITECPFHSSRIMATPTIYKVRLMDVRIYVSVRSGFCHATGGE